VKRRSKIPETTPPGVNKRYTARARFIRIIMIPLAIIIFPAKLVTHVACEITLEYIHKVCIPLHHEEVDGRDEDTTKDGNSKGIDKRHDGFSLCVIEESSGVILSIANSLSRCVLISNRYNATTGIDLPTIANPAKDKNTRTKRIVAQTSLYFGLETIFGEWLRAGAPSGPKVAAETPPPNGF
jgi:hypothetical protein